MNIRTAFKISVLFALALGAIPGWAQVPQSGVDGGTTVTSIIISSETTLQELAFADVNIPSTGSVWHCAATCSLEARLTGPNLEASVRGRLALVHESSVVAGTTRRFEVGDNPGVNDADSIEVSTTGLVPNLLPGKHHLSCKAAKTADDPVNIRVSSSSITVSCSAFHL